MHATTAQPAAPAGPQTPAVSDPTSAITGGKSELFARRKQQTRRVKLPGHEQHFLVTALRPIELQEINTYCLESVPDPKRPGKDKPRWNPMRSFYLIAKSLCESDGKPMFPAGSAGEQAAWLYGGEQVANFLTNPEVNLLYDAISEVSGLGDKAAEEAEKNSEQTGTGSGSSTSR